jgi:hypothetical protein
MLPVAFGIASVILAIQMPFLLIPKAQVYYGDCQ